jgi:hypothetical protein
VREILEQILADPRYQRNVEYGEPRPGHPEGKVKHHIAELEGNLEKLKARGISEADYWKLKFLIHVHDAFKAEALRDARIVDERSHATLARKYASQFVADPDLLNMIQFHDVNYALWVQFDKSGTYDVRRFQNLLGTIQDWDLFLKFLILDGSTKGKDTGKLVWFIGEVRKHKRTVVDENWVL